MLLFIRHDVREDGSGSGCSPGEKGGRRGGVEVVRRNRPHMVSRSWNFWHISRMLTQSTERLSTGTNLTDSAQLLTCRGAHMDMRTKIDCCGLQLDATVQNLNHFNDYVTM